MTAFPPHRFKAVPEKGCPVPGGSGASANAAASGDPGAHQPIQKDGAVREESVSRFSGTAGDFGKSGVGVSGDLMAVSRTVSPGEDHRERGEFFLRGFQFKDVVKAAVKADAVYEIEVGFVALLGDLTAFRHFVKKLRVKEAFLLVFPEDLSDDFRRCLAGIKAPGAGLESHKRHLRFNDDLIAVAVG